LFKKIEKIEVDLQEPEIWQDYRKVQSLNQKLIFLKKRKKELEAIEKEINDLFSLSQEESFAGEVLAETKKIDKRISRLEKLSFLRGKYDQAGVFFMLQAGAGGVDACDWVAILLKMYLRFFKKKNWLVKIIDQSLHREAGYKSVTLKVDGEYVYGLLKGEAGVHRLVRISPFDAEAMRHTSFALVEVLPQIEDIKAEIKEKDLKVETFLSSGHGGQNVQKVASAVRLTHSPTGIVVSCQSERSQYQNKKQALELLRAKLFQYYRAKREKEKAKLKTKIKAIAWGHQIRSYVFHPYRLVKDYRTNYQTKNLSAVLNGELEPFIDSWLEYQAKNDKL